MSRPSGYSSDVRQCPVDPRFRRFRAGGRNDHGTEPAQPYWSDLITTDQLTDFPTVARLLPQWADIRAEFDTETAVADIIDGLVASITRNSGNGDDPRLGR
ncbi:hypothetical protein [Nocardia sp. NPDC003979]